VSRRTRRAFGWRLEELPAVPVEVGPLDPAVERELDSLAAEVGRVEAELEDARRKVRRLEQRAADLRSKQRAVCRKALRGSP